MLMTRKRILKTAILPMAVLLLSVWLTGCATQRQVEGVKQEVSQVKAQTEANQEILQGIESSITQESAENRRLRADMQVTVDQLEMQITTLQESYNQLLERIDMLYQALDTRGRIGSSPGATDTDVPTQPPTDKPDEPPVLSQPDVECGKTYDDAFVLVRRAEYEKAIAEFEKFLENCPDHELVENAYYWIGESFYSLEKYPEAIERLQYLVDNFKASPNTSRALYKLGRSQEELGNKEEAKAIFQRLADEHPGTLEAEQAKERLKAL